MLFLSSDLYSDSDHSGIWEFSLPENPGGHSPSWGLGLGAVASFAKCSNPHLSSHPFSPFLHVHPPPSFCLDNCAISTFPVLATCSFVMVIAHGGAQI